MATCNAVQNILCVGKSNEVYKTGFFVIKVISRYTDAIGNVVDDRLLADTLAARYSLLLAGL